MEHYAAIRCRIGCTRGRSRRRAGDLYEPICVEFKAMTEDRGHDPRLRLGAQPTPTQHPYDYFKPPNLTNLRTSGSTLRSNADMKLSPTRTVTVADHAALGQVGAAHRLSRSERWLGVVSKCRRQHPRRPRTHDGAPDARGLARWCSAERARRRRLRGSGLLPDEV
jgi:hypothetical protein